METGHNVEIKGQHSINTKKMQNNLLKKLTRNFDSHADVAFESSKSSTIP